MDSIVGAGYGTSQLHVLPVGQMSAPVIDGSALESTRIPLRPSVEALLWSYDQKLLSNMYW